MLHLVLRPTGIPHQPAATNGPAPVQTPSVPSNTPPLVLDNSRDMGSATPLDPNGAPSRLHHVRQPLVDAHQMRQQQLHHVENTIDTLATRIAALHRESQQVEQRMSELQRQRNLMSGNGTPPGPGVRLAFGPPGVQGPALASGPPTTFPSSTGPPTMSTHALAHLNALQQVMAHTHRSMTPHRLPQDPQAPPSSAGPQAANPSSTTGMIPNADQTRTFSQSGVGPNGQRWYLNVNQSTHTVPVPPTHPMPPTFQQQMQNPILPPNVAIAPEVQAIIRGFDRNGLRQADNMQRSASTPPTARERVPVTQSSATRPSTPGPVDNGAFSVPPPPPPPTLNSTTPVTAGSPFSAETMAAIMQARSMRMRPMEPTSVYLLSSPTGPRAVLVGPSGTYYTPRSSNVVSLPINPPPMSMLSRPESQAARPEGLRRRHQLQQRMDAEPPPVVAEPVPVAAAHPVNPIAGAGAAQLWPMLWLMLRLSLFIWFFASGHNSWYRTLVVTAIAIGIFVFNTGVLHGAAENIFAPIRQHLENIIPLGGPVVAAEVPATRHANPGAQGELNPENVAQRLLEQRRRQGTSWWVTQVRRAEHSMLLFLASLIPGVGERHIAAREREVAAREEEIRRAREAAETHTTGEQGDAVRAGADVQQD